MDTYMNDNKINTEKLFSYGTLQYDNVQVSTFGRKLTGSSDVLSGYDLALLKINDENVVETSGAATHPILIYTGDATNKVSGIVFDISQQELLQADGYEVDDYKRVIVQLDSGTSAWVYVSAK
jgi:gamma-glutamylcyclotransferase (GGCT)/AIG2-like uncharacterized protein YtfP